MRLYIIGPVTGIEDDNLSAFREAQEKLHEKFIRASIPHDYIQKGLSWPKAMQVSVHMLTHFRPLHGGLLRKFDGVAMLPGWESSPGALVEKQVAEACGILCKPVEEWLGEEV